ncbi:serine/threonine protein kinase, CMGC, dual-specificity [Tilletia horrida]|nr:serine/threonine protein kinase, CMGC, dual-specificity [Tilletia horrida]
MSQPQSRSRSINNSTRNSVASSRALSAISSLSSLPRAYIDDADPTSPEFDFAALRAASGSAQTRQEVPSPPFSIAALSDDESPSDDLDRTVHRNGTSTHSSKADSTAQKVVKYTSTATFSRTSPSASFVPAGGSFSTFDIKANGLPSSSYRSSSGTRSPTSSLRAPSREFGRKGYPPQQQGRLSPYAYQTARTHRKHSPEDQTNPSPRQTSTSQFSRNASPSTYPNSHSASASASHTLKQSRSSTLNERHPRSLRAAKSSIDLAPSTSPDQRLSQGSASNSLLRSPVSPRVPQASLHAPSAWTQQPIGHSAVTSEIIALPSPRTPHSPRAPPTPPVPESYKLKSYKSLGNMPAPTDTSSGRTQGASQSFSGPSTGSGMVRRKASLGMEIDANAAKGMNPGASSLPQSPRIRSSASAHPRTLSNQRSSQGLRSMSSAATGLKAGNTAGRLSERGKPSARIGELTWATDAGPFGVGDVELSRRSDRFASVDLGPFGGGSEEEDEDDYDDDRSAMLFRPPARKAGLRLDDSDEEEDEEEDGDDDYDMDDDDAFTRRHKFSSSLPPKRGIGIGTVGLGPSIGLGAPPILKASTATQKRAPESTKTASRAVSGPSSTKQSASSRADEAATGGRWSEGFDLNAAIAELLNEDMERRRERRRKRAAAKERRRRREAGEPVSEAGTDDDDVDLDDDEEDPDDDEDEEDHDDDAVNNVEDRLAQVSITQTGKESEGDDEYAEASRRKTSSAAPNANRKDNSKSSNATPRVSSSNAQGKGTRSPSQASLKRGQIPATPSSKSRRTPVLNVADADAEWEQSATPSRASMDRDRARAQPNSSTGGSTPSAGTPNTTQRRSMEQKEHNRRLARQSGGVLARQSETEPLPASPRSVSGAALPPSGGGSSNSKSALLGLGGLLKRESKKNLNSPRDEKDGLGGLYSSHDSSRKTSIDYSHPIANNSSSRNSANSLMQNTQNQSEQRQLPQQVAKKSSGLLSRKRGKTVSSAASPPPTERDRGQASQAASSKSGKDTNGSLAPGKHGWTKTSMDGTAAPRRLSQSSSAQDLAGSNKSSAPRKAMPTITASPSAANLRSPAQDQQEAWPEHSRLSPSVPSSSARGGGRDGVASKPVSPVSLSTSRIPRATAVSMKSHASGTASAAATSTNGTRSSERSARDASTSSHRLSGSQSLRAGQSSLAASLGINNGSTGDGGASGPTSEIMAPSTSSRRQSLTLSKPPVSSSGGQVQLPAAASKLPANSSLLPILQAYKAAKTPTEIEAVLRRARVASYTSALTPSEREVLNSLTSRNDQRLAADSAAGATKERTSGPASRPTLESQRSASGVTRIGPTSSTVASGSTSTRNGGNMDPPASTSGIQRKNRASLTTLSAGAKAAREQALSESSTSTSSAAAGKGSTAARGQRQTAVSMTAASRPPALSPEPSSGASISSITTNFVDEEERLGDEEMEAYIQRQHAKKIAAGAKAEDLEKLLNFPEPEPPSRAYSPRQAEALWGNRLSPYEFKEMYSYEEIYYVGSQRTKKQASVERAANNFGYDDERGDYLIMTGDHIAYRYEIRDLLGRGSFGQVLQCKDHKTGKFVALKLIRNKKRFHQQALVEVKILESLTKWDPDGQYHVIRMTESFYFRNHLCIAMELLSINLYELIKANNFAGFSTRLIRRFTSQVLASLSLMKHHRVVHCDLKPENILLRHPRKSAIKVIDFGSSCLENEKVYTYIQSRFYRSPEVILGMNYHTAIDIWSLGCIIAELYTGYPLFPGENEQEQLACIMEVLGVPDRYLIDRSSRKKLFFDSSGAPRPVVNSKGKRRRPATKSLAQVLKCNDELFIDFIAKCLVWDPERRIKPDPALRHPWILQGRRMAAAAAAAAAGSPTPYATNGVYSAHQAFPRKSSSNAHNGTGPGPSQGTTGVGATPGRKPTSTATTVSASASRSSILSNTHATPARRTSVINNGSAPMRTPRSQQPVS